ncbi:MAG: 2,3-bisphosphoglycerate-independent phosphoglycerate mutase [bacterium]
MALITESLITSTDNKIVLLVLDGLGGLPQHPGGPTELEAATTPNLDKLARDGVLGLLDPIGPGITPGSGPAHLSLFGYDAVEHNVGRGLLSALGGDFPLEDRDVCARGNFCTLDSSGNVTDRRAGRIATELSTPLCEKLENEIQIEGVEIFIRPEKDHRFLLVIRGEHLSDQLEDTDSQKTGIPPLKCKPLREEAARTAKAVDEFTDKARRVLVGEKKANGVLLRGFAKRLPLPTMSDRFGLRAAALADYPMYRGLARLVGMEVLSKDPDLKVRFAEVKRLRNDFDFFFVHYKKTDAAGEDGDFEKKVKVIEELDVALPALLDAKPDVLIVTGDHSTPATMASHSWHPVPVLIHGNNVRTDDTTAFGETQAAHGGLGRIPMMYLLPIALAHAGRLQKFGA